MPDPFLAVGAAIVKVSLKIWLGKDSLSADAGSSIIDALKSKLSSDLERRQAQRFFEDLEVPVARRLQGLRESEFGSMANNEWTASVLAAGDSFDRAQLTAEDLFTRDLDPLFLERHIRIDASTATRDLSAAGTALYDRIISEGCAYIIEIADKLPHFSTAAFTELLRRDRQIIEMLSRVLDRIPEKTQGEPDDAKFATAYVRYIATKLDRLELFGLDFESPWYPLSLAYVSLRVNTSDSTDRSSNRDDTRKRNIEDRLATDSRIMVLGRAGSGKTTILQWMAVRAARSDFDGPLTHLNGCIPFFVRLREYVTDSLPAPEDFISRTAPMLAAEIPQGWVRSQLRSGRALLLIDGVDELPGSEREKVATWLQDLIELFPNVRYIITARPSAISADWLKDLSFIHTSLEAMPPSLVTAFVHHWHDAACGRLTDDEEDERSRLDEYQKSLLKALYNDRPLRDLADTPLLAGLLCALNRHLRSQLPRRRSEIYARALTMFDQRDRTRNIVVSDMVLDLAAKTRLLADLALWMTRNGESEVDWETATGIIERSLSSLPGIAHEPQTVLHMLLERSGLLREPASGHLDFIHRTFQEYLAAWAAVDGDVIGELIRNAHDDQWREVLVMAAGQTNHPQTNRLVRGLLRPGPNATVTVQRLLLAVSCLDEVRSLDSDLHEMVENKIPSLLPPQSMDQAEQLSKAGERLIPLLAQYRPENNEAVPLTIRAASLVGGPLALDLIERIVVDHGSHISESEFLRAWQYFDPDEYERRVLNRLKLSHIIVEDLPRVINPLSKIVTLREILVNSFTETVNLKALAALPNLEVLGFGNIAGRQLQGLRACRQVKVLDLPGFRGQNLAGLEIPPNLTSLTIRSSDIVSLAGSRLPKSLTDLTLSSCVSLRDIEIVAKLPRLAKIQLRDCPNVNKDNIPPCIEVVNEGISQ